MKNKPFYKSKEVWIGVIAVLNLGLSAGGYPAIDPSPEFYSAIIGLMVAIRLFLTEAKLSIN
jgi:hypothetical protein